MRSTFVILTGGRSTRFGSDKSTMDFAGEPIVLRILKGLPEGKVVIVGPEFEQQVREVTFVQEEPLGSGPVAAVAAAMPCVDSSDLFLIATDMPFASETVDLLLSQSLTSAALIPIDSQRARQPLCARYKTNALAQALKNLGNPAHKSMRALISEMETHSLGNVEELLVAESMLSKLVDIDTKKDYEEVLNSYRKELEEK